MDRWRAASQQVGRGEGVRSGRVSHNHVAGVSVVQASCLMGRRPNHSFKPTPLRGAA